MKKAAAFILWVIMIALPLRADSRTPIILMGVKIPGLFDAEKPGPYNEIYDRLTIGYEPRPQLRMAPLRRAMTSFLFGDADCFLFGTTERRIYIEQGIADQELLISDHINEITLKVYARRGETAFKTVQDLNGHYIALDQGAMSVERISTELRLIPDKILPAQTLDQAFLLLAQGRVNAVVAFDSDVNIFQRRIDAERRNGFAAAFSIESSRDAVVCRKTPLTEPFMRHIETRLAELKEAHQLGAILNEDPSLKQ